MILSICIGLGWVKDYGYAIRETRLCAPNQFQLGVFQQL